MFCRLGLVGSLFDENFSSKNKINDLIGKDAISSEYERKFIKEIQFQIGTGTKLILNREIQKKIQFIWFDFNENKFIINKELLEVVENLKNGKKITIIERNVDGTFSNREISLNDYFDTVQKNSVAVRLIDLFMIKLTYVIDRLNEYTSYYYDINKLKLKDVSEEQKEEHYRELALWLYTEVSKKELFTSLKETGLFYPDAEKLINGVENIGRIFQDQLHSIVKGELSILMIWLSTILLLKKDPEYNELIFYEIKKDFEISLGYITHQTSARGVHIITNYYNPFIRYRFDVDSEEHVRVVGFYYVNPEKMVYKDSIFTHKLPFNPEKNIEILTAIKNLYSSIDHSKLPIELKNIDFNTAKISDITNLFKSFLKLDISSNTALLITYYALVKQNIKSLASYLLPIKNSNLEQLTFSFYWEMLILANLIGKFNKGKDAFSKLDYILLQPQLENGKIDLKVLPIIGTSKYLRKALTELEFKSGWEKSAFGVRYNRKNLFFVTPNKNSKGVYIQNDEIRRIADDVYNGNYEVSVRFSKNSRKVQIINQQYIEKHNLDLNAIIAILEDSYSFSIYKKMPDRISYSTIFSQSNDLMRNLLDIVTKYPELQSSSLWYDRLFSDQLTDIQKFNNFYSLLKHIYNNEPGDWYGLKTDSLISIVDETGQTIQYPIIKVLVSRYFNFIAYYNLLMFSSGLPVLDCIENLVEKNVYIPRMFDIKQNFDETITIEELHETAPMYKNVYTGKINFLGTVSNNLKLKFNINTANGPVRETVTLSYKTFNPITVEKRDQFNNIELKQIMALRIIEDGYEKVLYLDENGNLKKAIVENDKVTLNISDRIYGAVLLGDYINSFGLLEAKHKIVDLLIYGGKQYNGLKYEAIADIFNLMNTDEITNMEKETPFLSFSVLSFKNDEATNQALALRDPVLSQYLEGNNLRQFSDRPKIISLSMYMIDSIIGNDLGWIFDYRNKNTEAYNLISTVDSAQFTGSRQQLLQNLYKDIIMSFIFESNSKNALRKKEIRELISNYYVNKKRFDKYYYVDHVTKKPDANDDSYIEARIEIKDPFVAFKNYYKLSQVSNNNVQLLFKNVQELTPNLRDLRTTYCKNLIEIISYIKDNLPKTVYDSSKWKNIIEIINKYYNIEQAIPMENIKEIQISPSDFTKISLILFPELLQAEKLRGRSQTIITDAVDYSKLLSDQPEDELLKLLPKGSFVLRDPYIQFYNFFSYLVCTRHYVYIKSTKTNEVGETELIWKQLSWHPRDAKIVKEIAGELALLWFPWLILRSTNIQARLSQNNIGNKFNFQDFYTKDGILNLVNEGHLSPIILQVLKLSLSDIKRGYVIEPSGETREITFQEKMLWIFIQESRYGDTITFNLERYIKAIEDLKLAYEINDVLKLPVEELNYLMGLLKRAYY